MGFFDRLFGRTEQDTEPQYRRTGAARRTDDDIAVERYRYLLRTAPPETIEQVHTEAFSKLTPEQRELLFQQLTENAPEGDKPRASDAKSLASSATRSELRQPGTMERSMAGQSMTGQGGMGFGSMVASSLLGTVAGYVIGSAIVSAFLPDTNEGSSDASDSDSSNDDSDSGSDSSSASDSSDSSADAGSDVSASGGDFGGGDFGGGDFGDGGGDFGGGFDF